MKYSNALCFLTLLFSIIFVSACHKNPLINLDNELLVDMIDSYEGYRAQAWDIRPGVHVCGHYYAKKKSHDSDLSSSCENYLELLTKYMRENYVFRELRISDLRSPAIWQRYFKTVG